MRTIIPKDGKLIPKDAKQVFKGQIFDVYHWQQQMFDGTYETFEMLKRPDTIKVIAIKDDKIVLLDQQQPNHGPFIDLPGGRHDHDNESEVQAAQRETLEETGMSFSGWKLVDIKQPHNKIDWFVYIFIATDFEKQIEQNLDAGEKITVKLASFDEIKKLANNPEARYLPKNLLEKVNSLEELQNLPEYSLN